jgi:hypothetical protein
MGGFIMDLKTLCMKGILFIMLFSCSYCYSQYTATLYGSNNRSFGAELRKNKGKDVFGAGMTTFFNREAKGIDYSGFYNPALAYEMVTGYNGSLFAFYGRKFTDLIVGTRIGLGARTHYYNGVDANGDKWYVTRDGGTYLLYGIVLSTALNKLQFSFVLDNINGISLGIGIRFNEYKHTKNENNLSHSKRISSLQGTSKPDTTILYTSRLKR